MLCDDDEEIYHTGYVDTIIVDGYVKIACDECFNNCIPLDMVRLFPEHTIPHTVGARLFARWTDGLYYHGFIVTTRDWDVSIKYRAYEHPSLHTP